ncbi:MAG: hypothetical protein ABIH99_00260 [Candidatus Micrarchaeota archaeon]
MLFEIVSVLIELPFIRKKKKEIKEGSAVVMPECPPTKEEEYAECRRRMLLYRRVIEKYADKIEEGENKSITELRSLVKPKDKTVQEIKEKLLDEFHPYLYERDFLAAAEKAFAYVRDEIKNETLPVEFWLAPEEIVSAGAADEMDKCILLCSLLLALQNQTAMVAIEADGEKHPFVIFELNGETHVMDPVHGERTKGAKDEVFTGRKGKENYKLIYKFNDKEYEEA